MLDGSHPTQFNGLLSRAVWSFHNFSTDNYKGESDARLECTREDSHLLEDLGVSEVSAGLPKVSKGPALAAFTAPPVSASVPSAVTEDRIGPLSATRAPAIAVHGRNQVSLAQSTRQPPRHYSSDQAGFGVGVFLYPAVFVLCVIGLQKYKTSLQAETQTHAAAAAETTPLTVMAARPQAPSARQWE
jgi:hypothetical protein